MTVPLDALGNKEKYKFTGEASDSDGLIYLRARYYDPSVGRLLSRDGLAMALANSMSRNAYSYAQSNPVRLGDPSGLTAVEFGAFAQGINWVGISHSLADAAIGIGKSIAANPSDALSTFNKLNGVSNFLSIGEMAISAAQDATNPNLSAGLKIGRTSENIGEFAELTALAVRCLACAVGVGVLESAFPAQSQKINDALLVPVQAAGSGLGAAIYNVVNLHRLN